MSLYTRKGVFFSRDKRTRWEYDEGTGAATLFVGGVAVQTFLPTDIIAATIAEINRVADVSARVVTVTAATLDVVEALHEGKTVVLNRAGGIDATLPAATGSGAKYRFVIGASTTDAYAFAVTGNDTIFGHALFDDGDGEPANGWTANGATSVSLGGATQASGGSKGDIVEFEDIAADTWLCRVTGTQGGTEVTPFAGP